MATVARHKQPLLGRLSLVFRVAHVVDAGHGEEI